MENIKEMIATDEAMQCAGIVIYAYQIKNIFKTISSKRVRIS